MKIRKALRTDVPAIIAMLANDKLGKTRERYEEPLPSFYYAAFDLIKKDPNQELMFLEDQNAQIMGTLQLSFLQYLTYQGGIRAQIEQVRVHE